MKALTNDSFKDKCRRIFNDRYSYEKTDLANRDEKGKVTITCPKHGDFKQYPYNHLRGVGCPMCANNRKKTTEEVKHEIASVHGDKYIIPIDFEYKGNKNKMHLICPLHGDFYPTYNNFIKKGCGCPHCSRHIYSQEEFISDLVKIYGKQFKYDDVIFTNYRTKIKLTCSKCGNTVYAYPKRALNGHVICDNCNSDVVSHLEREVKKALTSNSIEYVQQHTEEWLKNKQQLKIDFFLPKYNVGIECQGRFHFEPYKKGDEKSFENLVKQEERDLKKYKLCKEHGIELLYYSNFTKDDYHSEIFNSTKDLINKIIKVKNI